MIILLGDLSNVKFLNLVNFVCMYNIILILYTYLKFICKLKLMLIRILLQLNYKLFIKMKIL